MRRPCTCKQITQWFLENQENVGASKISSQYMAGEVVAIIQRWKHNVKKNLRYNIRIFILVHLKLLDLSIEFEIFFLYENK